MRAFAQGAPALDDELALLPGKLTPRHQNWLARLGAWLPFAQAALLFTDVTQVPLARATARRQTEAAGAASEALQTREVTWIEQDWPAVPAGPAQLLLSVDGAMVPVVHGEWAEVKTLALGQVTPSATQGDEPPTVRTTARSYFSRLTDAETFGRLALGEAYRRGVETAGAVAALSDGAEWIPGFVDFHCREALRILDFAHAAERIAELGQAVFGAGTAVAQGWLTHQLQRLKAGGGAAVLPTLRNIQAVHPRNAVVATNLAYLDKRVAHMDYPRYQVQGWPIGSGCVESANKLVVEARGYPLGEGAGMHWARAHVNPMLALRNAVCNDRWGEAWTAILAERRPTVANRRQWREARRVAAAQAEQTARFPRHRPPRPTPPPGPRKPAANHPWRRYPAAHPANPATAATQ